MRFLNFTQLLAALSGAWLLGAATAYAQESFGPYRWSLSPVVGLHAPEIEAVNEGSLKAPFLMEATLCNNCGLPNEFEETKRYTYSNSLDSLGFAANVGLEFQWVQSEKHSFLMGVSTWEGNSQNSMFTEIPLQSALRNAEYIRRFSLSYNEFYFGWRYTLLARPGRFRLYSRLSLNEIFDVDLREEHVFNVIGSDLDGVKRILIANAQTTGVLTFQLGLGGEYFVKKNISFGLEGGFLFSERRFQFNSVRPDTNFAGGDGVQTVAPTRPAQVGAPLGYMDPAVTAEDYFGTQWNPATERDPWIRDMGLRFDGWKLAFRFTVYY